MPHELRETVLAHAADLRALAIDYRVEAARLERHALDAEARLGVEQVRADPPAR